MHRLVGEESAKVNIVAEDESESEEDEDEEWWVGTVGALEVRDEKEETDESEPEGGAQLITSTCVREDDSGLEDEFEYPLGAHFPGELGEERWWSPELTLLSSAEEEEEVQHLVLIRDLEPRGAEPAPGGAAVDSVAAAPDRPRREQPSLPRGAKRRRLRKKAERTKDQEWEQARQDAWLREMLSDTSGSEDEGSCGRFAESGRWISELFKIPQHSATTSGGECTGQKTPDSS